MSSIPLKRKRDMFSGLANGTNSNNNSYVPESSSQPQQFASPKLQAQELSEPQQKKTKIESSPLRVPPPQGNFAQPITPTTPATTSGPKSTADFKQEAKSKVLREQKKNLIAKTKLQKDKISKLERLISSISSEKQICEEMYSNVLQHWTTLLSQFEANLRTFSSVNQEELDNFADKFANYMKAIYSSHLENSKSTSAELKELADRTNKLVLMYSSSVLSEKSKIEKLIQSSSEEVRKECMRLIEENQKIIENYTVRNKILEQQHLSDKKEVSKIEKLLAEAKKEIEELNRNSDKFETKYKKLKLDMVELLSHGEGISGGIFVQASQSSSLSTSQLSQSQQLMSPVTPFSATPFSTNEVNKSQEEEIQTLRSQLETYKTMLDKRSDENAKLDAELQNIHIHYSSQTHVKKTSTYMELQKCYDTLFKLYDLERTRVASLERNVQSMSRDFKEKYDAMKNESKLREEDYKKRLEQTIESFKTIKTQYEEYIAGKELKDKKDQEKDTKIKELTEKISALEKRIKDMQKESELYSKDKDSLVKTIQLQWKDLSSKRKQVEELKSKAARFKEYNKLPQQTKTNLELQSTEQVLKKQIEELEQVLKGSSSDIQVQLEHKILENKALSEALDDYGEQTAKLEKQIQVERERISAQEEENRKLSQTLIKCQTQIKLLKDAAENSDKRVKALEEVKNEIEEVNRKLDAYNKLLDEDLTKCKSENLALKFETEKQRQALILECQKEKMAQDEVSRYKSVISELESKIHELQAVNKRNETRIVNLEADRDRLKQKIEGMNGNPSSYVEGELEEYKQLILCPVCNQSNRDRIITRCFHMFCNKCIAETLNARNRKCPTCKTSFGQNDVHEVYL